MFMCQWRNKKITCAGGWILVPQSLDGLHIMLISGIIIIYLSESIEFNFIWALNTIEISMHLTFCYFFVSMENESKCRWKTLKIIGTRFLNVIVNLFWIIIFIFISLRELFWLKHFNYFVNRIDWKLEEATIKILSGLLWIYNKNN